MASRLYKHLHNRLVTFHGLDFGIPAETTGFGLLVYNGQRVNDKLLLSVTPNESLTTPCWSFIVLLE